ncbi:helix-turn-helix domain-containing protein [Leuconostoc gelidum subsp. gasicomitatum]|uniref:helix-turn-helix domain-containing protein n=1 Tax=Leuconostoc gasicomitatum TaxID=115778 RepID=UPI001CC6F18E|nr:helix-turn-helix domain-containing protein [Leuconostoc gasicomitatum]MBZ5985027.1 helix-turn-helix domain-containing protein [Leuconostoc gasicomitatum]
MTELEKASSNVRIKFKIALLERGMKQIELAHMLGASPAQVSRALAGNITPKDIEIQKRAADILNIEV